MQVFAVLLEPVCQRVHPVLSFCHDSCTAKRSLEQCHHSQLRPDGDSVGQQHPRHQHRPQGQRHLAQSQPGSTGRRTPMQGVLFSLVLQTEVAKQDNHCDWLCPVRMQVCLLSLQLDLQRVSRLLQPVGRSLRHWCSGHSPPGHQRQHDQVQYSQEHRSQSLQERRIH